MASRAAGTYPEVPQPLSTPGVDTHCHLDIGVGARGPIKDGEPAPEVEPEADETFPPLSFFYDTAMAANITRIVQIGCEMASARWTAEVVAAEAAAGRDWMLGGVAIHPNEAPRLAAAGLLEESLTEIEQLARAERIRVVGETGLDYFRTEGDGVADQQESFRAHIEIAKRLDKVLEIHDREAHADVLRILEEEGAPEKTVFHCFSGDAEMARYCAERGYYMSFAGNVTFKRSDDLRHAASVVPDELLLTETDAPFLTPHPHRGKPGGPYMTALTVRMLAEVRGVDEDHIAGTVGENAERIFGSWALS
ncbi:TatD family hydrolase [Brevibacterium luteolum]|uniref:TatD family hydrolase n=1 Tax=Brevibacterium luteolum TaxID=199591 RepID=UPI00223BDD14|nr:TatD family hydrolase [Brevibacterium luteolum]MCT1922508.1 TatD family hydrolase [Brevibacterium luteolum]